MWTFVAEIEALRGLPRARFKDQDGHEAIFFYDPESMQPLEGPADPVNHPEVVAAWFDARQRSA